MGSCSSLLEEIDVALGDFPGRIVDRSSGRVCRASITPPDFQMQIVGAVDTCESSTAGGRRGRMGGMGGMTARVRGFVVQGCLAG